MNAISSVIGIALLCLAGWTHAAEFSGKVIAVLDGDTLMVMQGCEGVEPVAADIHRHLPCGGKNPVKVRLAEVDAPEKAQPYGSAAQQSLAGMVMGKRIQVASRAIDDYGRMIAMVNIDGMNVNYEQVRRGMAWEYSRFHNNRRVMALQREAQQAKRGLWAGEKITEPAQWRKLHPSISAADAPFSEKASSTKSKADLVKQLSSGPTCIKKYCSQMSSCEEARDYLSRCGNKMLDGDGDGVPCEKLCVPTARSAKGAS